MSGNNGSSRIMFQGKVRPSILTVDEFRTDLNWPWFRNGVCFINWCLCACVWHSRSVQIVLGWISTTVGDVRFRCAYSPTWLGAKSGIRRTSCGWHV